MIRIKKLIKSFWNEPYYRFIVLFLAISLALYTFNEFYIGITAKGGYYSLFLDEHLNYIRWWRHFTLESTAQLLSLFDYEVVTNQYSLKVIDHKRVNLVYSCLGYGIMSVFAAFALTFPERIYKRFLFLFLGLLTIQLLNTLRLALLCLYWDKKNPLFGLDHHDLFNYVVYAILIALTYSWLKLSRKRIKN